MTALNKHMTIAERQIIETGITNGSTKKAIADTIGKDPSTVGKEIKLHRQLTYKCNLPLECRKYAKCKHGRNCTVSCPDYVKFKCPRRDRSPGACNGCADYSKCRFNKYRYYATDSHHEYRMSLVNTRIGVNATLSEIRELGEKLKPLLERGQSVYAILQNHPEIKQCDKTIYNYIEDGVFQEAGVSITCMDLKRQVRRRESKDKDKSNKPAEFSPRKDKRYLIGRKQSDYEDYVANNPYAKVVQMDTVYNDESTGPFIQTFEFTKYDLLVAFYHEQKTSENMLAGILLLEQILGPSLFEKECEVIKTDRGTEFVLAEATEMREDGSRRTRIYYCDPMASWQKGSVENQHITLREICPKKVDLHKLGLVDQTSLNLAASHLNSYVRKKLDGKSPFQFASFMNQELVQKLFDFGLFAVSPDEVTLKPFLFKKG